MPPVTPQTISADDETCAIAISDSEVIPNRSDPQGTPPGLSPAASKGLQLRKASDVPLRKTFFLDREEMIPKRSQTILFGPAGLGKTTYAIGVAAKVTRGDLPGIDGPRNVLISSQEDELEGVMAPRALAAGADLDRIYFIDALSLPSKVGALEAVAKSLDAALVIIDPIAAHLDSNVDSHNDASTRKALAPIAKLAADLNLAVLTIAHPNKATGGRGLSRLSGSGGFGNAARSVLVFGADPADPEGEAGGKRIIGHLKCNVGKRGPSISAEIDTVEIETEDGPVEQTRLRIIGTSTLAADDLLDSPSSEERSRRDEAREFLLEALAGSSVSAKDLRAAAEDAGVSWRTVESVKKELGIKPVKESIGWVYPAMSEAAA